MEPDITIVNATTSCPVIVAHSPRGWALLDGDYLLKGGDWACIDRVTSAGNWQFRELHDRIVSARIVVRHDQASAARLDELIGGEYSVQTSSPRVA